MARPERKISSLSDAFGELSTNLSRVAFAPNMNSYVPHKKQIMFHSAMEAIRLYIGGNRSGKTTGGIMEDIWWLTNKHPYRKTPDRPVAGRIVSVDFQNGVNKIIIPQLKQWIPPSQLKGGSWYSAYTASERLVEFENGSTVELMSYDQDLDKFAGTSRDFIHFDEEPPKSIYTECMIRLIDRKGHAWITMTPVEGMTWMYDTVYEPGILGENPRIKVIIVNIAENPHLDKEEIDAVIGSLDEGERKAREEGKFVQMGGLIYKMFNPEIHLIDPIDFSEFQDKNKYKIYMSLDHGLNNPTSVHWHAVDQQGDVITFDEHYEAQRVIDYHAGVIRTRNGLHGRVPDINICDPALAQRNAVTGTSIQTEYALRGIGFALANNDVRTGIAKVAQYLTPRADGTPTWRITKNNANLIKEIQRYRWKTWSSAKQRDQNNPYDEPHKKDDHAMDECRYFFTLMPELEWVNESRRNAPNIHDMMKDHAGTKGMAHPWKSFDPNLTAGALQAASRKTEWTEVNLND